MLNVPRSHLDTPAALTLPCALHVLSSLRLVPAPEQVFKSSDPAYAQAALKHAQELYALANLMPTNSTYCAVAWCGAPGWIWSSSSVFDDLSLAASWLYVGTGELVKQKLGQRTSFGVGCSAALCVLCVGPGTATFE